MDGQPRTFIAVHDNDWQPGPGWYVVDEAQDDAYIAFCGPDDAVGARGDAERIARLLTESER